MLILSGLKLNAENAEKRIIILVASYNNEQFYTWNLDSIFSQNYSNYHVFYINDCSTDNTYELVKNYIKEKGQEHRITLINNTQRKGALYNFYTVIHRFCAANDLIIAICDGDDALSGPHVLSSLNNAYQDPNVWLTYGQFREYPSNEIGFCAQYPDYIVSRNTFREYGHTPSHLRSFYSGLFKKIKKEDLLYNGDFFPMTCDMATMIPMIEMARGHYKFISEVLYLYNAANPLSDHRVNKELQRNIDIEIRNRNKYAKIASPFDGIPADYEKKTIFKCKGMKIWQTALLQNN